LPRRIGGSPFGSSLDAVMLIHPRLERSIDDGLS
jgi:hypothetical protein